jgi:hypothetical protein
MILWFLIFFYEKWGSVTKERSDCLLWNLQTPPGEEDLSLSLSLSLSLYLYLCKSR